MQHQDSQSRRPIYEVAFTFFLILCALWTPRPLQDWISLSALGWIVGSTVLVPANRNAVELGISGFRRAIWIIPAAIALATLDLLVAHHEQTLHLPFGYDIARYRIWGYVIWSFFQQFILQDYFLVRLLRVFKKPFWAIVVSASLFACAHIPNPVLMVTTLVWGLAACTLFWHYRDLWSLGFAHAVFGLTVAISVPAAIHHNMRVGLGYLRYHPHVHAQRSQIDHKVSTVACVMADAAILRSARHARP